MTTPPPADATAVWRNPRRSPRDRAAALAALMTLEEKAAQLVGVWVGADASGGGVAPHQSEMRAGAPWSTVIGQGLGQLTRPFGTAAIDPVTGARSLAASQAEIAEASRFGIPAQVHALIDRALLRVLSQKAELGLLDGSWKALPDGVERLCLDDEESRDLALRLAQESVVLLRNTGGILPLVAGLRVALVGPVADDPMAMLGCYSFPAHVGAHPEHGLGIDLPSLRDELSRLIPGLDYAPGCAVDGDDASGIAAAAELAADCDVCVLAVGDRAGLFGRGTSGEGCDAPDLRLPGVQGDLVRAVLATGTPVVLVLLAGRPYALGAEVDAAAAILYSFFPGQRGGEALAGVLTGAVNPSGRLPMSVPRDSSGLPSTYLSPPLGRRSKVSSVDPTPAFPFGHGLSYTSFEWSDAEVCTATATADGAYTDTDADATGGPASPAAWPVDGEVSVRIRIRNTGTRPGTEIVQLYLHDPVAQTTRPVVRLVGFTRVALDTGEEAAVRFTVPADVTSFTGVRGRRIVEPGDVELRFGRSSGDVAAAVPLRLSGAGREVGHLRRLEAPVHIENRSVSVLTHGEARG